MSNETWLANAKAGDPCMINYSGRVRRCVIDRTTKTQIIVSGTKYRRATGGEVGARSSWRYACVHPVCEESLAAEASARKRSASIGAIRGIRWQDQTDEVLAAVIAALGEGS